MDFLSNFNPADLQKYFQDVNFPLNKDDVVKIAEDHNAPGPLVNQLRERLPQGEYSNPQEILNSLGR